MVALRIDNSPDTTHIAFTFAPRLTHDRVDRLTPRQQAEALHEFVELYGAFKRHIFNPGKNPHTRVLALATLLDQAEKTSAKHKALNEPLPFWAGRPDQEGSFAARTGLGQNFISTELRAYEQAGLVARPHRRTDNGNDHIDLAVMPALLNTPELLPAKGERPRKPTVHCRSCGSDVLYRVKHETVTCGCCGTIHSEHKSDPVLINEPEDEAPIVTREVTIEADTIITREVTIQGGGIVTREVTIGDEQKAITAPHILDLSNAIVKPFTFEEEKAPAPAPREIFASAAALLVEIAGDEPMHAEMNRTNKEGRPLKYGPVYHAFGLQDAQAHLSGKSTRAARIRRKDGTTRAICVDGDNAEEWASLEVASQLLYCAGYRPLLEPAPACSLHPGGGHLWIVFDGLVDARSAWRHVCEIAPMLAEVKEYWPASKQNVRLPGGRYVTPEASEQCKLYDVHGLVASTRPEAAAALLSSQTPTTIVPAYPPDPEPAPKKPARLVVTIQPAAPAVQGEISFSPDQLAAWFNARTRLEDILAPVEHGKLPRAFPTWREHGPEPHVTFYPETKTWCDYGDNRRGGDALELYVLVSGKSKKEVLSDLGREYRAELLANKNITLIDSPVKPEQKTIGQAQAMVPAPEKPVEKNEKDMGAVSALKTAETLFQVEESSGPAITPATIYDGPYAPPARACMPCGTRAWQWNEAKQNYECGVCHPKEMRNDHAA